MRVSLPFSFLGLAALSTPAYAYYLSLQEIDPSIAAAFPGLPAWPFAPDFNDILAASEERLAERDFRVFEYLLERMNLVTFGDTTLPAIFWLTNLTETGLGDYPKEFHFFMQEPRQFFELSMTPEQLVELDEEINLRLLKFEDSQYATDTFFETSQSVGYSLQKNTKRLMPDEVDAMVLEFGEDIMATACAADEDDDEDEDEEDMMMGKKGKKGKGKGKGKGKKGKRGKKSKKGKKLRKRGDYEDEEEEEECRELYTIDTRIMGTIPPHTSDVAYTQYGTGSLTLLGMEDGSMKPLATSVTMYTDDGPVTKVFSRETSNDSQWRLALISVMSSVMQFGVFNHVYSLHLNPGTLTRSLFNNIATDHPLYDALVPVSKYNMQFLTSFAVGAVTLGGFSFEIDSPTAEGFAPLFGAFERVALDDSFYDKVPSVYLAENNIPPEFYADEEDKSTEAFRVQLLVETEVRRFINVIVDMYYADDAAVAADESIQAFAADAVANGLNGLTIRGDTIMTKMDLEDVLSTSLYMSIYHGALLMLFLKPPIGTTPPDMSICMMSTDIVTDGDDVEYSINDMLRHLPNTKVLFDTKILNSVLEGTIPFESLLEEVDLYENSVLNEAMTTMRNNIRDFLLGIGVPEEDLLQWPLNGEN